MLLITCFIFGLLGSLTWAVPFRRRLCPSGTFAYEVGSQWYCYKYYENEVTFQHAEKECQHKWNGHLASFSSDKEAKSLAAYVNQRRDERRYVWIGLRRNKGSSMISGWYWIDGSRSSYRKWGNDEPNNVGYHELCVALGPQYDYFRWNDLPCNRLRPYLCKWKST